MQLYCGHEKRPAELHALPVARLEQRLLCQERCILANMKAHATRLLLQIFQHELLLLTARRHRIVKQVLRRDVHQSMHQESSSMRPTTTRIVIIIAD